MIIITFTTENSEITKIHIIVLKFLIIIFEIASSTIKVLTYIQYHERFFFQETSFPQLSENLIERTENQFNVS